MSCIHNRKYTRSRNKGVEVEVAPLAIISKTHWRIPGTLGFARLEIQVPRGSTHLLGDISRIPFNHDLHLLPGHNGLPVSKNQQVFEAVTWFLRDQQEN